MCEGGERQERFGERGTIDTVGVTAVPTGARVNSSPVVASRRPHPHCFTNGGKRHLEPATDEAGLAAGTIMKVTMTELSEGRHTRESGVLREQSIGTVGVTAQVNSSPVT